MDDFKTYIVPSGRLGARVLHLVARSTATKDKILRTHHTSGRCVSEGFNNFQAPMVADLMANNTTTRLCLYPIPTHCTLVSVKHTLNVLFSPVFVVRRNHAKGGYYLFLGCLHMHRRVHLAMYQCRPRNIRSFELGHDSL